MDIHSYESYIVLFYGLHLVLLFYFYYFYYFFNFYFTILPHLFLLWYGPLVWCK